MKILIWKSKHDDEMYDASTPEKELEACLKVFNNMFDAGDYECCPPEDKASEELYNKARRGDGRAAKAFLFSRSDYEYEGVELKEVK